MADPLQILLTQFFQRPSLAQSKANILAIAGAAGLSATAWILGEPSERWIEIAARAIDAWGAVPDQALRGLLLDLLTDPGDVDVFGNPDTSPDQTPRPGWLSVMGLSWYGTSRGGQTFATPSVTVTNTRSDHATITIRPFDLTFERSTLGTDGGPVTYRNAPSASLYVGIGGTLALPWNVPTVIPLIADQPGSNSTATPGQITTLVTQSFGPMTVSGSTGSSGFDREPATGYRNRCRLAADRLSPGGPTKAYQYAATTQVDPSTGLGAPLLNYSTGNPVQITGALVSAASSTGQVTIIFFGPNGHVDDTDVSSANANIGGILLADSNGVFQNPTPLGVLPDAVTLQPETSDPATLQPGGVSAIDTTIAVTFAAKIKASAVKGGAVPGTYTYLSTNVPATTAPANVAAVFSAIALDLTSYLPGLGPGALDQSGGAGVVYKTDIEDEIRSAYGGLYAVVLSAPSASTTSISSDHIATAGTITGTLTVVAG